MEVIYNFTTTNNEAREAIQNLNTTVLSATTPSLRNSYDSINQITRGYFLEEGADDVDDFEQPRLLHSYCRQILILHSKI